MTTPTEETMAKARQLLAAEYESLCWLNAADRILNKDENSDDRVALGAICAALESVQPAQGGAVEWQARFAPSADIPHESHDEWFPWQRVSKEMFTHLRETERSGKYELRELFTSPPQPAPSVPDGQADDYLAALDTLWHAGKGNDDPTYKMFASFVDRVRPIAPTPPATEQP